jgi:hypothetical protein
VNTIRMWLGTALALLLVGCCIDPPFHGHGHGHDHGYSDGHHDRHYRDDRDHRYRH